MKNTCGIVLAGVHQWTDAPFDRLGPRPLMPVAHVPLVGHVLRWLKDAGVGQAVICANSASRAVRRVLGDGSTCGVDLRYYEDWTPRGPAGCIRDAAEEVEATRLVVAEGTMWPECELRAVLRAHAQTGTAVTVVAATEPAGGADGDGRLVPAGIYVIERTVLAHIPQNGYQDVKEMILPRLHARGLDTALYTVARPGPRLTGPASYLALNALGVERLARDGAAAPGYRRVGLSLVHETARLAASVRLLGRVLIGPRTEIAAGAVLIGPTTLGTNCVIEADAVVCRSVLWNHCFVGRRACVDRAVLADGVRVPGEETVQNAVRERTHAARRRRRWRKWVRLIGGARRPAGPAAVQRAKAPSSTTAASA